MAIELTAITLYPNRSELVDHNGAVIAVLRCPDHKWYAEQIQAALDAARRREGAGEVIAELASRGPFIADDHSVPFVECRQCFPVRRWSKLDGELLQASNPASHEPSCLWRRSVALARPARTEGSGENDDPDRRAMPYIWPFGQEPGKSLR